MESRVNLLFLITTVIFVLGLTDEQNSTIPVQNHVTRNLAFKSFAATNQTDHREEIPPTTRSAESTDRPVIVVKEIKDEPANEDNLRKQRCDAILSTMQRIMDNYHTGRIEGSNDRYQRKLAKLNSVKDNTYKLMDTTKFDEYTTTTSTTTSTTTTTTTSTSTTQRPFTIGETEEEYVNVVQRQEPGSFSSDYRPLRRSWEQLNDFRKNPVLSALYEKQPNRLMHILEKITPKDEQQTIDPLFVNRLILEKRLKLNSNASSSSLQGMLVDFENRPIFQRAFVEAPDLLKYLTMAIAIKLPRQKFDFINSTLACDFPRKFRQPPLPFLNPTPWYTQLKHSLTTAFSDRPYPWRHHLQKLNQCVVSKTARNDFPQSSAAKRLKRDLEGVCYEYDKMLEYQKDFLNDVIEYPKALEIILRNDDFSNVLLEQAIRMEILWSLGSLKKPIHDAILIHMIRNRESLDVILKQPRVVLAQITSIGRESAKDQFIKKVKSSINQYLSTQPDDAKPRLLNKVHLTKKQRPNVNIRISK